VSTKTDSPRPPFLRSIGVENFKAIRKSGMVRLAPLTVFIGNNGSGKSSLIEAARTYQRLLLEGVDEAFADVLGFEHVRNKRLPTEYPAAFKRSAAIWLRVKAKFPDVLGEYDATVAVNGEPSGNRVFIEEETIDLRNSLNFDRNATESTLALAKRNPGKSMARQWLGAAPFVSFVERWQFVLLNPDVMGKPRAMRRTGGRLALASDGGNLAEYLLDLAERSPSAFNGVVEAMSFVLPYAAEIQAKLADDLERRAFLELVERVKEERYFRVPGWLFSTGTLRVLAILALLRDPDPPPVIFIEELENGLDPRTVGLLIEEIRSAVKARRTQIIATTHSPYLLDQLLFEHVVVVERNAEGQPEFWRPQDERALDVWARDFSLGQIYTMGQLHREPKKEGS
jgi:predicted ATPase